MPTPPKQNLRKLTRTRPGIALVITLSILVLLTVALSKTFQDTALEIKMVRNEENDFMVRQVSRSFFKVFLFAIKDFGANKAKRFIDENLPKGFPVPITGDENDGLILNPEIESMDHFININGVYTRNDEGPANRDIIQNIILQSAGGDAPPQFEIMSFIGQIADSNDADRDVFTENFLRGEESFINAEPFFQVRNKPFDLISEIKVLPAFQRLNLQPKDIAAVDFPFTTIKTQGLCLIKNFNLNFLPKNEDQIREAIEDYLNMMKDVQNKSPCFYEQIYNSGKEDALVDTIFRKLNNANLADTLFKVPLNSDPDWEEMTSAEFSFISEARTKLNEFFVSRSLLIRIGFIVQVGNAVKKTKAILKLDYGNNANTDIPGKIEVLYYNLS